MKPTRPVARVSTVGRSSPKRSVVHDVVGEAEQFMSAQDVHHVLRQRGAAIGLSTVYRNLQALADEHAVDTMRSEDGEILYRKCSPKHHHHLVCRGCGRVEEINGPTVEKWAEKAAAEHGFADVEHTLEIFGMCPKCT